MKSQFLLASVAAAYLAAAMPAAAEVRVWEGTFRLPVYEEDPPDVNPPFSLLGAGRRSNYPYTMRTRLTNRRVDRDWRALFLENEYLKCVVLPDVGGHLYSCTDKISGKEMFYANPSLKKANISYRGAWSAFGIEFNFPVSHNWVSMSPVDFAIRPAGRDRPPSVLVGNTDRVYGMRWLVELILRPGSTVLEQRVALHNPSGARHRFYWWNNAGVEVWNDSRICYPMRFTASHGFTHVDTWPVNSAGLDLSVVANQTAGPVSQFVHGSREPFMGVYHPRTNTGTVHYAEYGELPAKKIWSWGVDPDGLDWRKTLSDNESAYVEVQAGLYRNKETYAFLEPGETIEFTEYWVPVREIGGIARANLHGVVQMERRGPVLHLGLNVNHAVPGATVRVRAGDRVLLEERHSLEPGKTLMRQVSGMRNGEKCTFELLPATAAGPALLVHTEGQYDWTPESEIKPGPQPAYRFPPDSHKSEGDFLELGKDDELNGALLEALATYGQGLERFPDNFELNKSAGRLAFSLYRYEEAARWLRRAAERISNDPETAYYLGLALLALGEEREGRTAFEGAMRLPAYRAATLLELGLLDARQGDLEGALRKIQEAAALRPRMIRAGAAEVILLRRLGRVQDAAARLAMWLHIDPTAGTLRHEAVKLGREPGEALWRHFAADPERALAIAIDYMDLGSFDDALELLSRTYPAVPASETEPGAVLPQDYALVAYYRGYCRERLKQAPGEEYARASRLSTQYVFPSRATGLLVLRRALAANPSDATAHSLLGSLLLASGQADRAIEHWQTACRLNPALPVLHRNLGRTLLSVKRDARQAAEVLREGLRHDAHNTELYSSLTQALSILEAPAAERASVLRSYPDQNALPADMIYSLALALAEAGDFESAEKLFVNRYFAREEGGLNVRQVYVEVQLRKAQALARAGKNADASIVARAVGKPVPNLPFTRDGMEPFLNQPRTQYLLGVVESLCGNAVEAQAHWQRALPSSGYYRLRGAGLAYAALAASKLHVSEEPELKRRVAQTLAEIDEREPSDEGVSGMQAYSRGMLLLAVGKTAEARENFQRALWQPDRLMSHYLSRTAMNE